MKCIITSFLLWAVLGSIFSADAQSIWGSPASMDRQEKFAKDLGLVFTQSDWDIYNLYSLGFIVKVSPGRYHDLSDVSFPFTLPVVKTYLERLAFHYFNYFCYEKLVITSLIRPISRQPQNAHIQSVHPTGIAFDLRLSVNPNCSSWLESLLLNDERYGILDVTRESKPPHYHVAFFAIR